MQVILDIKGKTVPLDKRAYVIGSAIGFQKPTARYIAIASENAKVDRKHAVLDICEDFVRVYDLFSEFGTYINGTVLEAMAPMSITTTSILQFGAIECELRIISREESCDSSGFVDGQKNVSDECPIRVISSTENQTYVVPETQRLSLNTSVSNADETFEEAFIPETQQLQSSTFHSESLPVQNVCTTPLLESQFCVDTQTYNEGYSDVVCSMVIPQIIHEANENEHDDDQSFDNEVAAISAKQNLPKTIPDAENSGDSDRLIDSCTPDLFDIPELALKTAVEQSVVKELAIPVPGDAYLQSAQCNSAENIKSKETDYITLSDKENMVPEKALDLEATQVFGNPMEPPLLSSRSVTVRLTEPAFFVLPQTVEQDEQLSEDSMLATQVFSVENAQKYTKKPTNPEYTAPGSITPAPGKETSTKQPHALNPSPISSRSVSLKLTEPAFLIVPMTVQHDEQLSDNSTLPTQVFSMENALKSAETTKNKNVTPKNDVPVLGKETSTDKQHDTRSSVQHNVPDSQEDWQAMKNTPLFLQALFNEDTSPKNSHQRLSSARQKKLFGEDFDTNDEDSNIFKKKVSRDFDSLVTNCQVLEPYPDNGNNVNKNVEKESLQRNQLLDQYLSKETQSKNNKINPLKSIKVTRSEPKESSPLPITAQCDFVQPTQKRTRSKSIVESIILNKKKPNMNSIDNGPTHSHLKDKAVVDAPIKRETRFKSVVGSIQSMASREHSAQSNEKAKIVLNKNTSVTRKPRSKSVVQNLTARRENLPAMRKTRSQSVAEGSNVESSMQQIDSKRNSKSDSTEESSNVKSSMQPLDSKGSRKTEPTKGSLNMKSSMQSLDSKGNSNNEPTKKIKKADHKPKSLQIKLKKFENETIFATQPTPQKRITRASNKGHSQESNSSSQTSDGTEHSASSSGERKRTTARPTVQEITPRKRLRNENSRSDNSMDIRTHNMKDLTKSFKICTSMVKAEKLQRLQKGISAFCTIVADPVECDILIMDEGNRTYKFLVAVARGLPILNSKWLESIMKLQSVPHFRDYMFCHPDFEKRHNFILAKSLELSRKQKLYSKLHFMLTKNIQPGPEDVEAIITCAGGRFLKKLPKDWNPNELLYVVTSEDDKLSWHKYRRFGAGVRLISTEGIMSSIMQQKIKLLDSNVIAY